MTPTLLLAVALGIVIGVCAMALWVSRRREHTSFTCEVRGPYREPCVHLVLDEQTFVIDCDDCEELGHALVSAAHGQRRRDPDWSAGE